MLGEVRGDGGEGAIERAAAAFDQLARGIAHALHFFRILEEVNHFDTRVFGTFYLDGGARFHEAGGHGRKIFHGRAKHGYFAKGGRFEDVVAAGIHEGATDENAVGEAVEGR